MVADGDDLLGFAVVINAEIIFPSLSDFPTAVALLMGLLYTINIDYPKGTRYTFKSFKRCSWTLVECTALQCCVLHALRWRLFTKPMLREVIIRSSPVFLANSNWLLTVESKVSNTGVLNFSWVKAPL